MAIKSVLYLSEVAANSEWIPKSVADNPNCGLVLAIQDPDAPWGSQDVAGPRSKVDRDLTPAQENDLRNHIKCLDISSLLGPLLDIHIDEQPVDEDPPAQDSF